MAPPKRPMMQGACASKTGGSGEQHRSTRGPSTGVFKLSVLALPHPRHPPVQAQEDQRK